VRIAFLDTANHDYTIASVYQQPLGGTSSAVCYLAEAMAKWGQEVFLLNKTTTPGRSCGVIVLPFAAVPSQWYESLDALVVVNLAGQGRQLRQRLPEKTRLILWTGHAHDQPAMQGLHDPDDRSTYDSFVLVSEWQRQQFHQHFNLDLSRTRVLRNAISPAFCDRFPNPASILSCKTKPPVLAYTSTPFRGLDLLLKVFPKIREAVPEVSLKVFSSMKVYNLPDTEYEGLYHRCQMMEGVQYIGSLSQPELAQELETVRVLAYPNTFAETSCIAVMEAMASGCQIVTSDRGALAETTAGFARLISCNPNLEAYKAQFVDATVDLLTADSAPTEARLRQQVNYVNTHCIWSVRAQEWLDWLSKIGSQIARHPTATTAHDALLAGEYDRATAGYEAAIDQDPTELRHFWYLGLALLLQTQSEAAQEIWMLTLLNNPEERSLTQLCQVLQAEQQRQQVLGQIFLANQIQDCLKQLQEEADS